MDIEDRTVDSEEPNPSTAMMRGYLERRWKTSDEPPKFTDSLLFFAITTTFAAISGMFFVYLLCSALVYLLCSAVRGDPTPDYAVICIGAAIGAGIWGIFSIGLIPPSWR